MSRHLLKTILLVTIIASGACATSDEGKAVTYSLTAKQNYDKGVAQLKDESYQEATRYFSFVRQKFPFSKYAVLAELGLADTQYERGNYQEAIDSYKNFIRLHPTHEKVEDGYVAYRICQCYVKEMPDDFFLLPPAYEKDQTSVRDALRELNDFVEKYPDSKYLTDAQKSRREVLARLIEHEVYVARFYLDRDHPQAAVLRLKGRRFRSTRTRGASPSCCWRSARRTCRWGTRCRPRAPSTRSWLSTARPSRRSARGCSWTSSGVNTEPTRRTERRMGEPHG